MRVATAHFACVGLALAFALAVAVNGAEGQTSEVSVSPNDNIAFRLLAMEAGVVPVPEPVRQELRELLEEAAAEVLRSRKANRRSGVGTPPAEGWERDAVIDALRTIDDVLGRRGYLHPVDDRVDLLTEALSPSFLSPAERESVMKVSRNGRRAGHLDARFPGPFRFVDCDTATAVYLGVGERLGLPLRMVYSPSRNRRRGHVWVRWGRGERRVDWETTEGALRAGFEWGGVPGRGSRGSGMGPAGSGFATELGREQVVGAWHYLLAVQHERQGDGEAMFQHLDRALAEFPGHLDARRQLAWNLATRPDLPLERVRLAVAHAREVVSRCGDADARDTLAAAYAANGDNARAVREARAAIADPEASEAARASYRQRLALYEAGRAYRQPPR